jgi:hypothetical protein
MRAQELVFRFVAQCGYHCGRRRERLPSNYALGLLAVAVVTFLIVLLHNPTLRYWRLTVAQSVNKSYPSASKLSRHDCRAKWIPSSPTGASCHGAHAVAVSSFRTSCNRKISARTFRIP